MDELVLVVQIELRFFCFFLIFGDFESNVAITLLLQVLVGLLFGLLFLELIQKRLVLRVLEDKRVVTLDRLTIRWKIEEVHFVKGYLMGYRLQ